MEKEAFEQSSQPYRKEADPGSWTVIALEGPVCAGKTTVLRSLDNQGVQVIEEYSAYVRSATRDFPKFPPQDEGCAKNSFRFFLDLELARRRDRNLLTNCDCVVLDRSIYTLLAFEAGTAKLTGIDILSWAVEFLKEHSDKIILPDHIIYIDTPVDVSTKRAEDGNIRIADFLLTAAFNEGFRHFFVALREPRPEFVTFVDGRNTREGLFSEVRGLF